METLELAKKLIGIQSVTGDEGNISDFLFDLLSENFSPRRIATRGGGAKSIFCSDSRRKSREKIIFNSHIDTVPPVKGWSIDPFKPKVSGGKLFGLGALDQKSGLAVQVNSFISLAGKAERGLSIALVPDEEGYSRGSYSLFERGLFTGHSCAVFSEPTEFVGRTPRLLSGARGRVGIDVVIRGKASHAAFGSDGVNAIEEAGKFLSEIGKLKMGRDPFLGKGEANAGSIEGGNYSLSQPGECKFRINWSTVRGEDEKTCLSQVNRAFRRVKSKASFSARLMDKPTPFWKAFRTDEKKTILRARKAFVSQGISPRESFLPSTFDGAITATLAGIPTIIIGPAGRGIHGADEFAYVSSIRACERITKGFVLDG